MNILLRIIINGKTFDNQLVIKYFLRYHKISLSLCKDIIMKLFKILLSLFSLRLFFYNKVKRRLTKENVVYLSETIEKIGVLVFFGMVIFLITKIILNKIF